MDQFLSIQYLGTFAGAVLATNVVVQVLKDLPGIKNFPTRWLCLITAEVLLFGLSVVMKTLTAQTAFLDFLNGFVVAASAMSMWQVAKDNGFIKR